MAGLFVVGSWVNLHRRKPNNLVAKVSYSENKLPL
jgi:hypothetical protein